MSMSNAARVTAQNFKPARATRRNTAALNEMRRLGRETAFAGLPRRLISLDNCIACNANIDGVTAAYGEGYDAGAAERAERIVRIATDRAEAAHRR